LLELENKLKQEEQKKKEQQKKFDKNSSTTSNDNEWSKPSERKKQFLAVAVGLTAMFIYAISIGIVKFEVLESELKTEAIE
jgi:hypothetical protein